MGVSNLDVLPYCPTTLYDVLGISSGSHASIQEIKDMYRNLAKEFHPDKHMDKSPEEKDSLEQQFNEIHHAYNILSNEESRQQYDQGGWEYIDSRFS